MINVISDKVKVGVECIDNITPLNNRLFMITDYGLFVNKG